MNSLSRNKILAFIIAMIGITFMLGIIGYTYFYILTAISALLLIQFIIDVRQTKHSLLRNYPIIARARWLFESERDKIQQYFVEDNVNGTPISREKRSDVYQKSKNERNTVPFGTQLNVYEPGYNFLNHSLFPIDYNKIEEPRITIGGKFCKKKYNSSIYNISAMSYGSLSSAAVLALNGGAKMGNFFHNTGEGGISQFHLKNGGDICFQIGTGYFGCGKDVNGVRRFDDEVFKLNATREEVKLIELKLSQGAKPGHGGILPASKNTKEISEIRNTTPNTDVISPPFHSEFSDNIGMLKFIKKLRRLSGYKPIGIKLCIGNPNEFRNLVKTMVETDSYPDFISIDGGEGGTGAAPLVFSNHIGYPLIDALMYANDVMSYYPNLKEEIKIIASGKATTSYDILKLISIGADAVNSARAFMLSLGCIQARECNSNTCPVGIATQNKKLIKGLEPSVKQVRVYNYHKNVIHEIKELMAAMGVDNIKDIKPSMFSLRNESGNIVQISY